MSRSARAWTGEARDVPEDGCAMEEVGAGTVEAVGPATWVANSKDPRSTSCSERRKAEVTATVVTVERITQGLGDFALCFLMVVVVLLKL